MFDGNLMCVWVCVFGMRKTGLIWASKKGHDKIVQILVDAGTDLNVKDEYG